MKAPLSWLKEYVDIDVSAKELEEKLFSSGFEVEETIHVAEKIDKIVFAKILEIGKHPNADKLSVTQVDAGKYGRLQIITSATNIAVGNIVPLAVHGATLAGGDRIFKGKLRGVDSDGMFCSGEELGINDDFYPGASVHGILIFNEDYPLGEEVKTALGMEDVIFDISITANRPDCQSILGLAREVAAVLNKPLKMPNLSYKCDPLIKTTETIKVTDKAYDLCPRYMAHYVKDIKLGESPLWLKRRLASMGIRSINNIVDITNYVLLEIGQPMHAFDLRELGGNEINIRRAKSGEKIITLDEKEFSLSDNNLVICDAEKPVALAGIMGGLNSGIKDETKEVVFESAKFARDNIRKSSRALGKRTDASSRYEKGVDAYTAEIGLNRALSLIDELKCGTIASDRYDLSEKKLENKVINTTIKAINGVLGIEVPTDEIVNILSRLEFKCDVNKDNISITVPLFREDVEDYPDISEEVIREYGYSHIKPRLMPTATITNGGRNEDQKDIDNVKDLLCENGFNEIITYSFVSEKEYDVYGLDKESEQYRFAKIVNPLGEDLSVMRTSLLPSLVNIVSKNLKRKNNAGRLFEFAKVYHPNEIPLETLPSEENVISLGVFGEDEDFFTVKGAIENLIEVFCYGIKAGYVRSERKYMHPTRSAEVIIEGETVGYFGALNPKTAEKVDVDKEIYVGEIYYDKLKKYFNKKIVSKSVPKFPPIERDLAVLVDDEVACGDLIDCMSESGGEYLTSVSLFDIYKGEQVGNGKKSMAFNLLFISKDRTLNVEDVDGAMQNILKNLNEKFGAELR